MNADTIAAIATPRGNGAIGIIRIDGDQAIVVADTIFKSSRAVSELDANFLTLGRIIDARGEYLDEVMLCKFNAPHSYTGNDLIELYCHGGMYIMRTILNRILDQGIRMAEPGEFTMRAFLNGKMDLIQAEAVADLIRSKTDYGQKSSLAQLQGRLSANLAEIKEELKRVIMLMEIDLDFAEEDIELESHEALSRRLVSLSQKMNTLIQSYSTGKILREGAKIVLIGRPNVGKSSLLNRLLNHERAIVTEIPGTTRDSIEENMDINGVLFRIVDTAGIRKNHDRIERESVLRTLEQMMDADILCIILDGSEALTLDDQEMFRALTQYPEVKKIYVQNKIDLKQVIHLSRAELRSADIIKVSCKTGENIRNLEDAFYQAVFHDEQVFTEGGIITRQRHKTCLANAEKNLQIALKTMEKGYSYEFVSADLRAALNDLAELVGEVTRMDILQQIFSEFCIGK